MLSVTGTAAIINLLFTSGEIGLLNTALSASSKTASGGGEPDRNENSEPTLKKNSPPKSQLSSNGGKTSAALKHSKSIENNTATVLAENILSDTTEIIDCSICHIPYNRTSVPFNEHMKKCLVCK